MSKSTSDLLGGFQTEAEFEDTHHPAALPIPDAGISIAELQSRSVPLEWYEAVAITQGLCETLAKWGDQVGRVRIQTGSVFIGPTGSVNVTAGIRSEGAAPLQQVAELLGGLLADEVVPTPLRLALMQTSESSSLEEWSKAIAYYERPNRVDIIKAVYERAVNQSASLAPHTRPVLAKIAAVEVAPVVLPPPAVVPARHAWQFPKVDSRYIRAASAVLGIPILIGVFMWLIPPRANQAAPPSSVAAPPPVPVESAATDIEPFPEPAGSSIILQPALPPRRQRTRAVPESQIQPRAGVAGVAGTSGPNLQPLNPSVPLVIGSVPPATDLVPMLSASRSAVEPNALSLSSVIYSQDDIDVVPPVAVYPQLPRTRPPGVGPDDVAEFYVVVSETGLVESVAARRVPATMAEAMKVTMSLSAAKAWRFKPGLKNGQPVRYRTLVWILKN